MFIVWRSRSLPLINLYASSLGSEPIKSGSTPICLIFMLHNNLASRWQEQQPCFVQLPPCPNWICTAQSIEWHSQLATGRTEFWTELRMCIPSVCGKFPPPPQYWAIVHTRLRTTYWRITFGWQSEGKAEIGDLRRKGTEEVGARTWRAWKKIRTLHFTVCIEWGAK